MICRADEAEGLLHTLCPDDPPRLADRTRAVVRWLVLDEITREAPEVEIAVETPVAGLVPRVSSGGRMGLVGNPGRLFPGLDLAGMTIPFSVAAPGYLPRHLEATLGPVSGFPDAFAPADRGVVQLHRAAIVLRGRVVRLGGVEPTPLVGAEVRLAGLWSTFPPPQVDPATVIEPADVVSLHPGLYAGRLPVTDGLRRRDLVFAVGEEKALLRPAVPGDTQVRVGDRVNLTPGTLLAFERGRPDRVEYVTIKAVKPGAVPDEPATLTLTHPLRLAHEAGTICVRATPQAPAAPNSFTRDGIPGERVAFLTALAGLVEGAVVEIDGGAAVEYQTVRLFATTSDADGFFRFPPIARVASVKLRATSGALPPQEPVTSPDYRCYETVADVIFP